MSISCQFSSVSISQQSKGFAIGNIIEITVAHNKHARFGGTINISQILSQMGFSMDYFALSNVSASCCVNISDLYYYHCHTV